MTIIYCDESGNSGEKLIDKDQPFFVLASNDFSKSEALDLLEHVLSKQGAEPKFSNLKKTANGVKKLTRLFADPRLNKSRVAIDVYHKKFMVITKMVDLIAETLIHNIGGDLYQRGANIAMSNMLYYCMPTFCGKEVADNFLENFVNLMRYRTDDHVRSYYQAGRAMLNASTNEDFKKDLFYFTEERLFHDWFDGIGLMVLDPAIPSLFEHINEWGRRKQSRFRVIHDDSKPVLASEETFHSMMALSGEESAQIGYDRRKFNFPLRAISLEQGNSLAHPQIQIADLCAGAINHFLKCREIGSLDSLAEVIRDLDCIDWAINGLYPTKDVDPRDLGTDSDEGVNPIDPMVDYLQKKRK